jgi:lipoate-protein ligase A
MINSWRFFPLKTYNAFENMAFDEALYRSKIENPGLLNSLRLYQWFPDAVSIGKHQDLEQEINLEAALNLGVDVVRRITGGGAVFHDHQGEITYSIIASVEDYETYTDEQLFISLLNGLETGFKNLGIKTTYDKINCPSLFVNGKKISGNAQARHKDIILQHGTILYDYRPELMYDVLRARPNKPRKKMIESVYAYVTTIKNELGMSLPVNQIANEFEQGFKENFLINSWIEGYFNLEEKKNYNFYLEKRFLNKNWLYEKIEV